MALTDDQKARLKAKLLAVMSNKAFTPENFSWPIIENGINSLSDEEKDRIAKSLAGSGDEIASFIRIKLRDAILAELSPQIDIVLSQDYVPIDFLAEVLL